MIGVFFGFVILHHFIAHDHGGALHSLASFASAPDILLFGIFAAASFAAFLLFIIPLVAIGGFLFYGTRSPPSKDMGLHRKGGFDTQSFFPVCEQTRHHTDCLIF